LDIGEAPVNRSPAEPQGTGAALAALFDKVSNSLSGDFGVSLTLPLGPLSDGASRGIVPANVEKREAALLALSR
jgi:hypothetical protein